MLIGFPPLDRSLVYAPLVLPLSVCPTAVLEAPLPIEQIEWSPCLRRIEHGKMLLTDSCTPSTSCSAFPWHYTSKQTRHPPGFRLLGKSTCYLWGTK